METSNGEVKNDTPVEEKKDNKSAETFTIKSPPNVEDLDEESISKIVEHLGKGKYVLDKYNEGLTKAHSILLEYYPQEFGQEFELSMEKVKKFKETMETDKVDLDDHTKLVFAQHLLTCNKSLTMLFEEPEEVEVKSQGCDLQDILKKAPKVTMKDINEMCQMSYQAGRQKNKLIEELKHVKAKMEGVDSVLSADVLKYGDERERQTWTFLIENTDKLCELSAQLGPAEVITLTACKTDVEKILEKMDICTKNWTAAGAHLEKKSPAMSSLVLGPLLVDIEKPTEAAEYAKPTRTALHQALEEQRKKLEASDPVCVAFIKNSIPSDEMESYDFVFKYLIQALCKGASKPLVPEEKVYLGYHFGKAMNVVRRMSTLSFAKRVIEGSYVFKDNVNRNHGGFRGGYRSTPYNRPYPGRYGYGRYAY